MRTITPARIGALVRDARTAAGLSQSELGKRIGASRFWVAEFEKGKPGAELGLALKAIHALGLAVRIEPRDLGPGKRAGEQQASGLPPAANLGQVIAHATLTSAAPSLITGWPPPAGSGSSRRSRS